MRHINLKELKILASKFISRGEREKTELIHILYARKCPNRIWEPAPKRIKGDMP